MSVRPILVYPNPGLRTKTVEVYESAFDQSLHELAIDMEETMNALSAFGLAAPQIADTRRVIIIAGRVVPWQQRGPLVLVNPVLTLGDKTGMVREGCLSFPGAWAQVRRALDCTVVAKDPSGAAVAYKADGLFAHCLQHEVDHLDGKLLVDLTGPVKRDSIKRKFRTSPPFAARVDHVQAAMEALKGNVATFKP